MLIADPLQPADTNNDEELQTLVVNFVAFLPQVAVHDDQGAQADHCGVTGHSVDEVQVSIIVDEPGHVTPPKLGTVNEQVRVRTRTPTPQVAVHSLSVLHDDHCPSIGQSTLVLHVCDCTGDPAHGEPPFN